MYRLIVVCMAVLASGSVRSQHAASFSLKWNAVSTFFADEGTTRDEATSLITLSGDKIEWRKQDGLKRSFEVVKTVGSWANVNAPGEIRYQVTEGSKDGIILIQRNGNAIKASITMASDVPEAIELKISTIENR